MNYTNFVKVTPGETSYTFGYLWYKESESSNDRHLYLGKSGKGSCIHIVYNKREKQLLNLTLVILKNVT